MEPNLPQLHPPGSGPAWIQGEELKTAWFHSVNVVTEWNQNPDAAYAGGLDGFWACVWF